MIQNPITIKIIEYGKYSEYVNWIIEHVNRDDVTYFFPKKEFTFGNQEDATAFLLKFYGKVKECTK